MAKSSNTPTEAEYLEAWAHFVGTLSDLGVEVFNVRRDPASDGHTFSLRKNAADEGRVDAAMEQLRRVEVPYVMSRLAESDAARRNLELSAGQLHLDASIAAEHGLIFSVAAIVRSEQEPRRVVEVTNAGDFEDPGEAIAAARALGQEATVSVHGRPYWDSRQPEVLTTPTLHDVAFEVQAGPVQTEYVQRRRHVVDQHERLCAILAITPEVVAAIGEAADDVDAIDRLTQPPHLFSALQARHVLLNMGLHQLTLKGRAQLSHDRDQLTYSYPEEPDPEQNADDKVAGLTMRLEIVETLLRVLKQPAAVVAAITETTDHLEARAALMGSPWNLTKNLATHVLNLPFGRTTEQARADLREEGVQIRQQIDALTNRSDG